MKKYPKKVYKELDDFLKKKFQIETDVETMEKIVRIAYRVKRKKNYISKKPVNAKDCLHPKSDRKILSDKNEYCMICATMTKCNNSTNA